MRTPAGKECSYYYADYLRGRSKQECRLLDAESRWEPSLCSDCPVPGIQLANGCPDMRLQGKAVKTGFLKLRRRVTVYAYCRRAEKDVEEPHIGCGLCHAPLRDLLSPPLE